MDRSLWVRVYRNKVKEQRWSLYGPVPWVRVYRNKVKEQRWSLYGPVPMGKSV